MRDNDDPDPAGNDEEPSAQSSPQDPASDEATTGQSPPDDEQTPPPDETPVSGGGDAEEFVSAYYALLPEDTDSAWRLLSSEMQAEVGSYDDYVGFWSTIDDVTVDGTAELDADTVEVMLTYLTDGTSEQEVRQIDVAPQGESFVVVGD